MAALGSAIAGLSIKDIPALIHIPIALSAGFLFGAIWGLIPGYLEAVRGVNKVITTLLLNYIATQRRCSRNDRFCHSGVNRAVRSY